MNSLKLSLFGLLIVGSFFVLSLLARFLLPFSDEPDWGVRIEGVLFGNHPFWSPYYIFQSFLSGIYAGKLPCEIEASPLSLFVSISSSCAESFEEGLIRWALTLFVLAPMFLVIIFRRKFIIFMQIFRVKLSIHEWNHRIDALALSLLFPGMIFYLGILAEEQLYLVVALYLFLFWEVWIIIIGLLLILLSIDFGNSLVAIFFVATLWFSKNLLSVGRNFYFFSLALFVGFAFFIGVKFLDILLNISFVTGELAQKSEGMLNAMDGSDLLTKYPVFLRPIITFMSFVFLTPSGVKIPILYMLFFPLLIVLTLNVVNLKDKKLDAFWFTTLSVILFFVFLFPTYSNAKYYIFMLPFLIYVSLVFSNKKNIFYLLLASNVLVFLHLFLYRL